MLYLGIDQHSKQITIALLDEEGNVEQRRQVSTRPEKTREFLQGLQKRGPYMALLEVCGFNDWLIKMLKECGCREIVLIHPERPSKKKTDRRDAYKLAEMLWLNRGRLKDGKKPKGLRRVHIPTKEQQQDRQLTSLRQRLGRQHTRVINRIKRILHRHNRMWECPTKTFQTKAVRKWLADIDLPPIDRLELDSLIAQWDLLDQQLQEVNENITARVTSADVDAPSQILRHVPGLSDFGALAVASRIGDIERFPHARSLPNYFGLTPGCRNSGNATDRLGSITKEGSQIVRFLLGQAVLHVLKRDPDMRRWYRRIRVRRGSKIARVAVMRRLCTIIWHMLKYKEPYYPGGPPRLRNKTQVLGSGSAKGTLKEELAGV